MASRTRTTRSRIGAATLGVALLLPTTARAAPNDAAALALHASAMGEDYLRTDFAGAQAKILQALTLCGSASCARATKSRLQMDLATIAFAQADREATRAHFAAALQYDPTATPDADVTSAELRELFDASREGAAARPADAAPTRAVEDAGVIAGAGAEECPPDFPGCRASRGDEAPSPPDAAPQPETAAAARNWISVAFQQDVLALTSAQDACAGGSGYTCFAGGGSYYADTPLRGADDTVSGGFAPATRRVMLGYDRVVAAHVTLGARVGFAFGGGPQRPTGGGFLPLHLEARAAYWFGRDPLTRTGLRPFILVAAGAAQIDARVAVKVYPDASAYERGEGREVDAWKKTGLGFAALGAGAMLALSPRSGLTLECRAMEMVPRPTTAFGVQLGYAIGL